MITNIDKLPPIDVEIELEQISEGLKVIVNTNDAEQTDENTKSGIGRYEYYVKTASETTYKKYESLDNSYIIPDIKMNVEYTIYAIAYDKAGNFKQSENKNFIDKLIWDYSASSTWTTYPAEKAFDNNSSSYWHSASGVNPPHWLKATLNGKVIYLDSVDISFRERYLPTSFKIEGSNDDENWDVLGSYTSSEISQHKTYDLQKKDKAYSMFRLYLER